MQRLLIACALCAGGGAALAGCGENSKSPGDKGWETSEFTELDPENSSVTDVSDPDTVPDRPDVPDEDLLANGAACTTGTECAGGSCLTGAEWPDGYCTTDGCSGTCDTPGSGCVDSDLGNFCADYCGSNSDCRTGYGCQSQPGSPGRVCVPTSGGADGEGCLLDGDCAGDTCATDWPGGFCTTTDCETFEDCNSAGGENNKCLQTRGGNFCVRICTESSDCREGYLCEGFGNGEGMCSPDPSVPFDDLVINGNPFDLTCQTVSSSSLMIDYEVAADSVAYMVTPIARDGRQLQPDAITNINDRIDLARGANGFQSTPAYIYNGSMNPTIVPAAPQFMSQLKPGAHQYGLETNSTEICHYVLQESEYGDKIDLNVYFVDVPGMNAANAATHTDMQEVLTGFDAIWGTAGFAINKVRYFDITGQDATRYSVLRSEQGVTELVALSKRPGNTMDDVLSVNIFFTRAFAMDGAIGISMGLPGPAGLHGTVGSGVAFTAEYLGATADPSLGDETNGNAFTAQIIAHEVGHYLGLFHTTESYGGGTDPLSDTPECGRISQSCPDYDNLMFPVAGSMESVITPEQKFVLQVSPLTKNAVIGGAP